MACNEGSQNDPIHIDLFGTYNGETRVDRGWLTKETVVQLKLYNEPIRMWKKSLHGKAVMFLFFLDKTQISIHTVT